MYKSRIDFSCFFAEGYGLAFAQLVSAGWAVTHQPGLRNNPTIWGFDVLPIQDEPVVGKGVRSRFGKDTSKSLVPRPLEFPRKACIRGNAIETVETSGNQIELNSHTGGNESLCIFQVFGSKEID